MEGWIQVQVMVPQHRMGEFHEMFGRWLQGPQRYPSNGNVPTSTPGTDKASWTEGSSDELLRDASRVYKRLSHDAKRILDYLLDQQGNRATAADLVRDLDLGSPNVVAGTLASFRFQCDDVDRPKPFDWIPGPSGATIYELNPKVVDLFRRAREQTRR